MDSYEEELRRQLSLTDLGLKGVTINKKSVTIRMGYLYGTPIHQKCFSIRTRPVCEVVLDIDFTRKEMSEKLKSEGYDNTATRRTGKLRSNNTSGINNVQRRRSSTGGVGFFQYQAHWVDASGTQVSCGFSCNKWGERKAKRMAEMCAAAKDNLWRNMDCVTEAKLRALDVK